MPALQTPAANTETLKPSIYREPGCTCADPNWDNRGTPVAYQAHEETCALAPDLHGWLYYGQSDGLGGGAWVNPKEPSHVYIRTGDDNACVVRCDLADK